MTRLYSELADWWPILSPPAEYAEGAAVYTDILLRCGEPAPRSLLEMGSGGGSNASHMKAHFDAMTLVDPAPAMLAHSRPLNPKCEHLGGDMRTLRLDRLFDRVFVHDAICYMTTEADLRAAFETAFVHCRPGGAALFAPDYVRETFVPATDHGGTTAPTAARCDTSSGRAIRIPDDTVYLVDYAFLLQGVDGDVRVVHDRHVEGLFPRRTWLRLLEEVGFAAERVPYELSEVDREIDMFVGRK